MANSFVATEKMADALDKALVQKAVTGFFADNDLAAKFVGAKTVSIPDLALQGLADYSRSSGFVGGDVTVARTTYTLTQDRGRSFQIDAQDNDESGVANLAGQIMGEFVRTQVVPEIDAYTLSKIAGVASGKSHTVSVGASSTVDADCYKMFQAAELGVREALGFGDEELVCFCNPTFWAALQKSTAFTRQITVSDFNKGGVDLKVQSINGIALLPVAAARMKSAYTFNDGTSSNQTAGGFTATSSAKGIGFILMPRKAASMVKKTEVPRMFTPKQNLNADAYKIDYRVYYDVFVKKNMRDAIYAYIEA